MMKNNNTENRKNVHVCVHSKSCRTEIIKNCIRDFQCSNCAFDQWLDETDENRIRYGTVKDVLIKPVQTMPSLMTGIC